MPGPGDKSQYFSLPPRPEPLNLRSLPGRLARRRSASFEAASFETSSFEAASFEAASFGAASIEAFDWGMCGAVLRTSPKKVC